MLFTNAKKMYFLVWAAGFALSFTKLSMSQESFSTIEVKQDSIGRGWPTPDLQTLPPGAWRNAPDKSYPARPYGEHPAGISPLEQDIYTSSDFYKDKQLWSDPRYFRCLSSFAIDNEASSAATDDDPNQAPWGHCERDYPREAIVSPYPFATARQHYEALLAETELKGGPTQHSMSTLPNEWNGTYLRNVWRRHLSNSVDPTTVPVLPEFYEPVQWSLMAPSQASTILSLLTPDYQQHFVQQLYHQAHNRAAQWSAMFCRPEGFMRQWSEPGFGPMDVMVTPERVQLLVGGADNVVRNFNIGRSFNMQGTVPHLGQQVPRWYGESIAFWDGDALITWTSNIQGWFTHGAPEHSNRLQTIEIFTPRNDSNGEFIGLEHETIFYDEDALLEPVRQVRFFSKWHSFSEGEPYTYVRCNQSIFLIEGRGEAVSPGVTIEYKIEDFYNRPWAAVWKEWFEDDMTRPEDEPIFGF